MVVYRAVADVWTPLLLILLRLWVVCLELFSLYRLLMLATAVCLLSLIQLVAAVCVSEGHVSGVSCESVFVVLIALRPAVFRLCHLTFVPPQVVIVLGVCLCLIRYRHPVLSTLLFEECFHKFLQ